MDPDHCRFLTKIQLESHTIAKDPYGVHECATVRLPCGLKQKKPQNYDNVLILCNYQDGESPIKFEIYSAADDSVAIFECTMNGIVTVCNWEAWEKIKKDIDEYNSISCSFTLRALAQHCSIQHKNPIKLIQENYNTVGHDRYFPFFNEATELRQERIRNHLSYRYGSIAEHILPLPLTNIVLEFSNHPPSLARIAHD
jgi:hypothetical protein